MKKLTKLFSLLTVLVTILGPLGNIRHLVHADDAQPQQTKVFVHKILLNKEQFADFDHEAKKDGYNGNRIGTITDYFGSSAKDIGGVTFKVYKQVADTENGEGVVTGNSLLGLEDSAPNSDTKKYKLHTDSNKASITTVENTGAEVVLENGIYIFVEDKEHSPYYNKQEGDTKGSELTEAKAVPFKLELPVTKPDGTGYFDNDRNPLHVYPKNTEDKPTVTKKFADTEEMLKNVEIGEEIPYKITTEIPKGSSYKTIVWEDLMVAGLDFVTNSLTITSEQLGEDKKLEVNNHYTLTQDKRGFLLKLNEAGLAAIEEVAKTQAITITLNYKATLNDSAIVDAEIPNQVTFHYGNRPRTFTETEPKPVTPKEEDGKFKVKVKKVWGDNTNNKQSIFDIYEKETGVKVGQITIQAGQTEGEITEGIKKGVQYIAVEQPVEGYIPTYKAEPNTEGTITVTNNPSDNPPPLTPDKPEVITHGKRFIKTDDKEADEQGIEKLLGAEFVVKNQENKYLALKNAQTQQEQLNKYKQAEEAYRAAVKAKNEVDTKKAERDAAYEALNMQWEWVNDKSQAFTFISSTDGKFEVKGLKQGTYYLEETKAPEGYALLSTGIEFQVQQGSWNDNRAKLSIDQHTQIRNKKVTIPQTGGIGTLVFTVVGLSAMAFAFIAMKKRQSEEA
ncbi:SpaH/EbpB family LPXTG-anchored major pilin [Streptococcus suis]|nr:SpaH/EbpB family LPXTG-anchored major pilin [Streptococcus suis]MBY4976012.1 SpaH/EbpB family LPXTG-anchored major pilin [Streptococcus suis]NQH35662.1 SpaH/EbpB family LPXTG-anchored major pilin [Streptococcus suis]CYV13548.1 cell wall surface anchor family protein [Streptococcus suis]HEL1662624.1 SpaH/EbpB family LPXTG-anchored major pilin [Streptococcus suis]HEL1995289.1 SpaH/EbpB family LPXTG-anchored major pilin [Streptococcus suis]